jgi:hypothetical protein
VVAIPVPARRPDPDPFDLKAAPYREDGHAVIAMTFGIEVTCLTLEVAGKRRTSSKASISARTAKLCNELPAGSVAA